MTREGDADPMTCEEASLAMPAGLPAGATTQSGPSLQRLDRHLERCARCSREWAELQSLQGMFAHDRHPDTAQLAQARLQLRRSLSRSNRGKPQTAAISFLRNAAAFLLMVGLLTPATASWFQQPPSGAGDAQRWVRSVWATLDDMCPEVPWNSLSLTTTSTSDPSEP